MRTTDTRTGYGWVSIALHWTTAIIVLTLWFVGSSIQSDPGTQESTLRLHTSIAITAYLLLWARVIWRLKIGHPGPPLPPCLPRVGRRQERLEPTRAAEGRRAAPVPSTGPSFPS